jgi:hypothetical protein
MLKLVNIWYEKYVYDDEVCRTKESNKWSHVTLCPPTLGHMSLPCERGEMTKNHYLGSYGYI